MSRDCVIWNLPDYAWLFHRATTRVQYTFCVMVKIDVKVTTYLPDPPSAKAYDTVE